MRNPIPVVGPNCITAVGNQEYVIVFAAEQRGSGKHRG